MFMLKNIALRKTVKKQIRGKNKEVKIGIVYFALFNITAFVLGFIKTPVGEVRCVSDLFAWIFGLVLLFFNVIISFASLVGLKDSWRVGVLEDQKTELISSGIYRFTRNPYFLSYLLMFLGYTVILQNIILLALSVPGVLVIHKMIQKEEAYLYSVHGDDYVHYKNKVPRYLFR